MIKMWTTAHPIRARKPFLSRAGIGITGIGALATALVLAAPNAGAAVTSVSAAQGMTFGVANYGTNCEYRVTAMMDSSQSSDPVMFTDSAAGTFSPNPAQVTGNQATTVWTPTANGQHTISATQGMTTTQGMSATQGMTSTTTAVPVSTPMMTVGNGINLGVACLVLP
ncbi:hypothetical protein [Nocardia sp. R6R-6]|uniref:hypothetical protein n=1 Tax=Nocardia sp. R6R-6 TaxID=3459303 RepID=UPI00403E0B98